MTNEEAVVSCLLNSGVLGDADVSQIPFLRPEHFGSELLGFVFRFFLEADEKGEKANYLSINAISERLFDANGIPQEETQKYLYKLFQDNTTSAMFVSCANAVIVDYKRRTASRLLENTHFGAEGLDDALQDVIEELSALQTLTTEENGMSLADMAETYADSYPKGDDDGSINTGIEDLDKILGGTQGGDLCFIGARPSAGKSAFANQIALHFEQCKKKVGFFNLEMQRSAVYERFLASGSRVSLSGIRGRRSVSVWEEESLDVANKKMRNIKNLVFYTGSFTASKIRRIVKRDKLDVVIIDYLQLLKSDGHYNNRASEVGEISHAIKAIAMDFNIPIFPLVQLNRAVEMRDDKEPTLSDIRESGDIEQDASQVIFLWTIPNPANKDDTSNKGCRVAKNRNGQLGSVRFKFHGEVMKFEVVPKVEKSPARSTKESMSYAFTKPLPEDQYAFNTSVTEDELPFA